MQWASTRFMDKVAIMTDSEMEKGDFSNCWRLCTITQVEVKILIRLIPTWATGIVDFAAQAQKPTTFIEQGMLMERRLGSFTIPAASLSTFGMVGPLVWIPIYEKTLVPLAMKFTGKERGFSKLQRIGFGLCLTTLAVVFSTLVETRRLQLAKELGLMDRNVAVPLSIFWQVPQYVILGITGVFSYASRLEVAYDQSPDSIRCSCTAFMLLLTTLGSYLNSLVLTIVMVVTTADGKPGWIPNNLNEGKLNYYFCFWAGFTFLNFLVYVLCAIRYKQKGMKNCLEI